MPKLPIMTRKFRYDPIPSKVRAVHVAAYLAHTTPNGAKSGSTATAFAVIIRKWFEAQPEHQAAFIAWYEKQP